LFAFNKADLQPAAKEKLAKVSGIMLAYPKLQVSVEGHTDSIGSDEYNLGLSERRAASVRNYLVSNGIPASNVKAIGLGKANPVADNSTEAGRQQNRRVELVVSGDIIGQPITGDPTGSPAGPGPSGGQLQQ
jgi:outer membrane protein OmpA-like peptidoglycan-associated protein